MDLVQKLNNSDERSFPLPDEKLSQLLHLINERKEYMDLLPLHKGNAKHSIAKQLLSVTNYDKK